MKVIEAILNDDSLKERFSRFYNPHLGKNSCWEWSGATKSKESERYGIIFTSRESGKKAVSAHRLSLFFKTHLWPENLKACHKCDNPPCVNPDHLYWGSSQQNSNDWMERKKYRRKYKSLEERSEIKKAAIRAHYKELSVLADQCGYSVWMLHQIKYGYSWKDVPID